MILTNYFTASKSRQNSHAAKRRKVMADIDVTSGKSAKLGDDKCASLSQETVATPRASRCAASSRIKQANRSRTRNSKTRSKAAQPKIVSEGVISVTTSLEDDHRGKKSRKQCRKNNNFESSASKIVELALSSATASGEVNPSQTGPPDVKAGNIRPIEVKPSEVKSNIAPPATQTPENANIDLNSVPQPANITSRSRTGLKVDPWIAEQAKVVLASRGRQALEKSLGRKKATRSSGKEVKEVQPAAKETSRVEKSSSVKMNAPRLHEGIDRTSVVTKSVSDESGTNLPAYKRFSHLLEAKKRKPSGVTRNLSLPYHFKELEEMFRCVDVVLSLKQKRYETCTFEKLKESVQQMCRKKFEKKHLAQMKAVYPTAFVFRQQNFSGGSKKSAYQLTVYFNFDGSSKQKPKDFKFIESSVLIARQKHFKNELVKITMSHHQAYLARNYPSLTVKDDEIMRWHPCFHLDEVPEIGQLPLPEPPEVKTFSTAQDVLGQARLKMAPRVEKALNNVAKKSSETKNVKMGVKTIETKKDSSQTKNTYLKGVSQSLIDKIRQKEELKMQESLTANSEVVEKRVMMQRLPELCRILKTYFVSERRAAIPLEDVSSKLAESYTSTLSKVQVEKHVKLLSEVAPEWLQILYVRKCPYVKLKKNVNINILIEKFKAKEVN